MWRVILSMAMLAVAGAAQARPADGELLDSRPCPPRTQGYDEYVATVLRSYQEEARLGAAANVPQPPAEGLRQALVSRAEYEAELAEPADCRQVFYGSDGLKVAGFVWRPPQVRPGARLPVVVMLRGGNRDFGKFGPDTQRRMAALTRAGFLVVGVQYRGVDGGDGREEFGGADVHDVLNAVKLARSLPQADPDNVFMWGRSRGGMMAYLAARDGAPVNAFVAESALADLNSEAERRPDLAANVWRELMPDWSPRPEEAMRRRSAVDFADDVDMPPVLLLHGTADWRAHPDNTLQVASRLQSRGRPYAVHVFENDTHSLDFNWRERDRLVIDWFRRHMR